MADLTTKPAEVHMTLQIVRAATGKTETVHLVGHVVAQDDQPTTTKQEPATNGSDTQHRRA